MNPIVNDIVKKLGLMPHPEGGFYRETYRSGNSIPQGALPKVFSGDRAYSTAIYFLIPKEGKSSFHRIKSDEAWHFYLGGPMTIVELHPNGEIEKIVLGSNISHEERLQYVVPAGVWFGAYTNPGTDYSVVGCTVAPGFDFSDFEMANREMLLKEFPDAREEIERLT